MSTTTDVDEGIQERVLALINKAESTPYPEEAEAFMAKAQQLITRHQIDLALLQATRGADAADEVTNQRLKVEAPYASGKETLLSVLARANNCRVVTDDGLCVVFGHRSDIEIVMVMFASLSMHVTRSMLKAVPPPGEGVRRFRHAFFIGFALRIQERLATARAAAVTESDESTGSSAALVLAGRSEDADEAMREAYPRLRTRRVSTSSRAGHQGGQAAANSAGLSQGVGSGSRRALGA